MVLAIVASRRGDSVQPVAPTLSGNGLTWVKIGEADSDTSGTSRRHITLFRAMGATPSAEAVTISFGAATQSTICWSIAEFSGIDTGGTDGSGAIVQVVPAATESGAGTQTITLAAFSSTDNGTYGGFCTSGDDATAGSGFTIISQGGALANDLVVASEFLATNDTTVDITWSTAQAQMAGVAVEIKAAAAGVVRKNAGSLSMMGVGI